LWRNYSHTIGKEETEMNKRMKAKAKSKVKPRHPIVEGAEIRIGKKGSTDLLISEVSKRLDQRKIVKVKILRPALVGETAENIASKVATSAGAKVIQIRGHTFTLYRAKKSQKGIYKAPLRILRGTPKNRMEKHADTL
jgi:putative YhbY family RNA-binding protein